MAQRFDSFEVLNSPIVTDEGFLIVEGYATRSGVFLYQRGDGGFTRELRPAEEVFKEDSLQTLRMAPVTFMHPTGGVNVTNARGVSVGTVFEDIKQDGEKVRIKMQIIDAATIAAITKGGIEELSCGYSCDVADEPGERNGELHDTVQRNIRYNHVAIVEKGRAGPEVRIKLDSEDAVMVPRTDEEPIAKSDRELNNKRFTMKLTLDGVDFDVAEQVHQAVTKELTTAKETTTQVKADAEDKVAKLEASLSEVEGNLEKEKARADVAVERADKAEEALKEATDPAKIEALVAERLNLERSAAKVLGDEVKFDSMSALDIKKAVVMKTSPKANLEGKSDEYIQARFDHALENSDNEEVVSEAEQERAEIHASVAARADEGDDPLAKVMAKRAVERQNAWRNLSTTEVN